MNQTLYLIRHCQATGQAPAAPLTAEGQRQSIRLASTLTSAGIGHIVASPYARAIQSASPLAQALDLRIAIDPRLAERVLSDPPIDDWKEALQATFSDLALTFPGGESSHAAIKRARAAIDTALAQGAPVVAIVSHGNLLSLVLHSFDPALGFAEWEAMRNPDIYRVTVSGSLPQIARLSLGVE